MNYLKLGYVYGNKRFISNSVVQSIMKNNWTGKIDQIELSTRKALLGMVFPWCAWKLKYLPQDDKKSNKDHYQPGSTTKPKS